MVMSALEETKQAAEMTRDEVWSGKVSLRR